MNKRAILGVSGSIAAYRAADLARELMRAGFEVRVCLTDAAQKFVTPLLFETLTGQPCLIDTFEEPKQGRMAHIDWAHEADVIVIAPATANTLNKLAQGQGEDMLTTLCLVTDAPLVLAPAMNPGMYLNENVQAALKTLQARGATIVEPTEGDVACGETGQGKLASIESIVRETLVVASRTNLLKGQKILITSGPTQEPIDDVRYLSNRSSGKMGAALARAALMMGAEVTVVTGPTLEPLPLKARVIQVRTAQEMLDAALNELECVTMVVGAAAVADYRSETVFKGKLRRSEPEMELKLVQNPDVIASLAAATKAKTIGFAAEPDDDLETARAKLARKKLHAIAVNDISKPGIGFESGENELTLVLPTGEPIRSGRRSKLGCALWLFESLMREESR